MKNQVNVTFDVVEVKTIEGDDQINSYINRGWKVLSSCTCFSQKDNCALTVATMGKPFGVEPPNLDIGGLKKYGV